MRPSLFVLSALVSVGLALLVAWWFKMSFPRAAILAPVIVVCFGAAAGVVLIWTRIATDPLLRRRRGP